MARPILVVKNIADAPKRYAKVAKDGNKAVRFEFGIPFALQDIINAKPRAKTAIFGVLNDGDRFNGQKLVRLLARTPELTVKEVVTGVEKAVE
jgi:hypothetical protein